MNLPIAKKKGGRERRRRLLSAALMVLLSGIMLATSSYAWLVLSTAPEVTGISTSVGANGSLEIALLTAETRSDPDSIRSNIGDSSEVQGALMANVTWGNLVDLSDAGYGLGDITLQPSQLMVSGTSQSGYTVSSNLLALPKYGFDGRITELDENTMSAVYSGGKFPVTVEQTFGVRGIGIVDAASAEANAVGMAKTNITAYAGSARNAAVSTINNYGSDLINIVFKQYALTGSTFGDTDVNALKSTISGLQNSLTYVETAMRYGILAHVAQAQPGDFDAARNMVMNRNNGIAAVYEAYGSYCPAEMGEWIQALQEDQNSLNAVYNECGLLFGGVYTWDQIQPLLTPLMSTNGVYIDNQALSALDAADLMSKSQMTLTLLPGSGVMANIASFAGNYSTWINYGAYQVNFTVRTDLETTRLAALAASLGTVETPSTASSELSGVGGYAVDLAFRCNAAQSDLLLQIAPEQRVYTDSISGDLQGGGSYMQFTTPDSAFSAGRMIELMDAIRVTFVDVEGNILAMAKLNTSNRTLEDDGSIKANLYLYEYALDSDRNVVLGQRRTGDVTITALEQNVAKAVTAVVWLDGNLVDNTMVAAETNASLNGTLNLQFASSADLIPAGNNNLYNSNASRTQLTTLLNGENESYADVTDIYDAGQGTAYTDVSWNAFASAYEYAIRVNADTDSSSGQIRAAYNDLRKAYDGLQAVTHTALQEKITLVRNLMGEVNEIGAYVKDGVAYTSEFTQDQISGATTVNKVDYNNNLHDEGNGIQTPVYTRESWETLALALYNAEAVDSYTGATDAQLNAQITALDVAYSMLERAVFYEAYDYNGAIYYRAITDVADTYGKWYDEDFHRVISDLTILDLDTGASRATVAKISAPEFVRRGTVTTLSPTLDIETTAYSSFKNDEVIGVRWGVSGLTLPDVNRDTDASLTALISAADAAIAEADTNGVTLENAAELASYRSDASAVLNGTSGKTAEQIEELVTDFTQAVADARSSLAAAAEDTAAAREDARTTASASEQQVLTAAVLEGQRLLNLEGSLALSDTARAAMTEKVTTAQVLLDQGETAGREQTTQTLNELNALITANGGTAKTAGNTLQYSILNPGGYYEYVNRVVTPSAVLDLTGLSYNDVATMTVSARILTRNGVVYTADKAIKLYNPAAGVEICKADSAAIADSYDVVGSSRFTYSVTQLQGIEGGEDVTYVCNETGKTYTWSVSDTTVAYVEGSGSSITLKVRDTGTVTLSVTVTMDTGSEYTDTVTINATKVAE